MPMDVLKDMLFRQLQWLEVVLAEMPEEQLKTTYSVMVQERIVELNKILEEDKRMRELEANSVRIVQALERRRREEEVEEEKGRREEEKEEEEEEERFHQEVAELARVRANLQEEVAGLVVEKEQLADKLKRLLQEVCGHLADKANLQEKVRALEKELETEKNKYKRAEDIFEQALEALDEIQEKVKGKVKDKCCITPVCMEATHANWCDECIKMPGRSQHASYPFKRI